MNSNPSNLEKLCRQTVRDLMHRHQWQLLSEENFVMQLLERAQNGDLVNEGHSSNARESILKKLTSLAVNTYCHVWYSACAGKIDHQALERGYRELARYLYNVALTRWHLDTETGREIAQNATGEVFKKIHTCRKPGAFIAFVLGLLQNEVKKWFTSRDNETESLEYLNDPNECAENPLDWISDGSKSPEESAVDSDLTERVVKKVIEICDQERKAIRQLTVVIATLFLDMTDEEIAEMMGTTVTRIYELRFRGLKLLRTKYGQELRALLGGGH